MMVFFLEGGWVRGHKGSGTPSAPEIMHFIVLFPGPSGIYGKTNLPHRIKLFDKTIVCTFPLGMGR